MRIRPLWDSFIKNWIYSVYILTLSLFLILTTVEKKVNSWVVVILIVFIGIITWFDRVNSNEKASKKNKILNDNIEEQKKLIVEMANSKI